MAERRSRFPKGIHCYDSERGRRRARSRAARFKGFPTDCLFRLRRCCCRRSEPVARNPCQGSNPIRSPNLGFQSQGRNPTRAPSLRSPCPRPPEPSPEPLPIPPTGASAAGAACSRATARARRPSRAAAAPPPPPPPAASATPPVDEQRRRNRDARLRFDHALLLEFPWSLRPMEFSRGSHLARVLQSKRGVFRFKRDSVRRMASAACARRRKTIGSVCGSILRQAEFHVSRGRSVNGDDLRSLVYSAARTLVSSLRAFPCTSWITNPIF